MNDENGIAEVSKGWFEATYGVQNNTWMDNVTITYVESFEEVEKYCRIPAYGCMVALYHFVIWDTVDDFTRCTTLMHEFGHMGSLMYGKDVDMNHSINANYFNVFIFEQCTNLVGEP